MSAGRQRAAVDRRLFRKNETGAAAKSPRAPFRAVRSLSSVATVNQLDYKEGGDERHNARNDLVDGGVSRSCGLRHERGDGGLAGARYALRLRRPCVLLAEERSRVLATSNPNGSQPRAYEAWWGDPVAVSPDQIVGR